MGAPQWRELINYLPILTGIRAFCLNGDNIGKEKE